MGKVVTEAFEKILKPANGRKPINLHTNDGKEFHNIVCWQPYETKTIHHFLTSGYAKVSIVERFNLSFKESK